MSRDAEVELRASVPSRIVQAVDATRMVKLDGNTHPMARKEFERGPVDTTQRLDRMMLVMRRSSEQEDALAAFSERQYDPKSPDYHRWLHAEEFGRLYGPSDADMEAVTGWLRNQGFEINEVSKGRVWIQFSGTVAQVQHAFHVEMHHYQVRGEEHIANDRDPEIPEALLPVVTGIASLHNFFAKPQLVRGKLVKQDRITGKMTVLEPDVLSPEGSASSVRSDKVAPSNSTHGPAPQLTYQDSNGLTHEDLTPYDFATIYNYLPLWNASKTGMGVTVAIAAGSDVAVSDFNNFRKTFGLPSATLNTIHNGTDPGADGGGNQGENTLDVEMVSAAAPGATIDLVVSADTSTTGGFQLSDAYIVDNEVAPIMSASYGQCELGLGTSNNAAFNKIWQQGATEGISIFESSGDQGSAGCTSSDDAGPYADSVGLQVNGMASSPYVTAVGGTDFTWSFLNTPTTTYWNASNNADLATAKGYLPEVPWNSTCANPLLLNVFTGEASTEQLCNDASNSSSYEGLVKITGGSGGYSHCTTPSGTTSGTCSGGYAKPSWQTGNGVPADGKRDLPDVSLFASAGFPGGINGSAILFCESIASPEKTCDYTNPSYIIYQEIGGTSASSPMLAGIMALIVQKTGSAQGLANPMFYKLAAAQVSAGTACDSSTDTNASTCVFHDISQGTISQVCITGDPNCVTNTNGDALGLLSGYAATKGYDEAVGLGSLNVNNLVSKWVSTAGTPAITLSPTNVTFPATTVGKESTTTETVTVKNTGTAAVTFSNIQITGTNYTSYTGSSTCSTTSSLAAGASCAITLSFTPTAAGTLTATLDVVDNAGTQTASITGTGTAAATLTVSVSPTSLIFASTAVGATTAAQIVTLKNTGTGAVTLNSETIAGTNASSFLKSATTCGASLAAGASCTVSVEFKPAAAGSLTGSLAIADNATGSPQSVTLSGTGTAAATLTVSVSPTSLSFAATAVGATTAAQIVTLKNTGTGAVTLNSETIAGTNASSFLKSATTCGASLAAGASCTVSVEFKPAAAGSLTGSLAIADTATGSPQSVALTGTGTAAATLTVSVSPTSLSFASTAVGATTAAQIVTVKNTGTGAVTLNSETIAGTNASSFLKSATTCGASLAAGASCTVSVEFKPAAAGSLTGSLAIADTATGSPQSVALTGTGTAAATLTVSVSPTSLSFASTAVGATTAAQIVTLKNTGTGAVTLNSETIAGTNASSFLKSATTCGASLAAGASCTVSVEFKPAAAGSLTGSLAIADNATGSPQSVTLSGTGTAAATLTVSVSPTSLSFASTAVGATTAAQIVTVKNTGTGAVTLNSETLTGTNASSFLKSATTCGASLAAGASCTVSVEFKPTAAGSLTGSLAIADTATGSPQSVALTGTGTAAATPVLKLNPTSIAFAPTVIGTMTSAQTVTLTNSGTLAATISSITLGGSAPTSFEEVTNCGTSLAANASCSIYVAFKPASAASLTATVSVTDSASGSPQQLTLSGTGTAAPSVKLSTTSIAFPTTKSGSTSAEQTVTVMNTGTASINLVSITLTGTNPTSFEALNTCGSTLAAGAICTVYVAFKPITTGTLKATLSVADNGAASPQSVALSGTGN